MLFTSCLHPGLRHFIKVFRLIMPAIRQVSKHERKWLHHYEQLKKYKETHGNCDVPTSHENLDIWVSNQRQQYWLLKEGKSLGLTEDCICKLESIGFQWSVLRHNKIWNERFQELKKCKKTYGNCNVSSRMAHLAFG